MALGENEGSIWAHRYAPANRDRPASGWVLLHGVTRAGPHHPAVARMALALARAGRVVLVPNVAAWRRLDLDPAPAQDALARAAAHLHADPTTLPGGATLVGLSFGCPQALRQGVRLARRDLARAVVCFGGYASLRDAVRFAMTGRCGSATRAERQRPDPYGRWVVAANYLHRIPGYGGAEGVSAALREMALTAADRGVQSWDPSYDDAKDRLAATLDRGDRDLFRLFAPPSDREPDAVVADGVARRLADAARATHPDLALVESANGDGSVSGPIASLGALPPVRLFHGRRDRLIPYTETVALERALRSRTDVKATVSGLFSHSGESEGALRRLPEAVRLFHALRETLALRPRPPARVDADARTHARSP